MVAMSELKLIVAKIISDFYFYLVSLNILAISLKGVETVFSIIMLTVTSVYGIIKIFSEHSTLRLNRLKIKLRRKENRNENDNVG
jgi:hypothetical protein